MDLYRHGDSGFLYLSFQEPESEAEEVEVANEAEVADDEKGGDFWIVVQEDDDTPIYADIAQALNAVAAAK
jgi:hypothetical protein